jgi:DNA-binding PadR family transcriptional regulator
MHWPLHAYRIAKIANNILGPEEQMSRGTLSTVLAKLEQAKFIADADEREAPFPSDRPSRAFVITSVGRERFSQLMLDTTSHPGSYSKTFHIKALHLEFLAPEHQLFLVEHYLQYSKKIVHNKQEDAQKFGGSLEKQERISSLFRQNALEFMRLKVEQWQLEIEWAQSLHDTVLACLRQTGPEKAR